MMSGTNKFSILSLSLFTLYLMSAAQVFAAPVAPNWTSSGHRKIKINSLKLLEKGLIDPVRGCAGWMRRDLLQRIVE